MTRRQFTNTLHLLTLMLVAAVATLALIAGSVEDSKQSMAPGDGAMLIRPHVKGSPAALAEAHGCWTGPAPRDMTGKVPGHVVVTRPGATGPTYGGPRLVAKALDQVFAGIDHGLRVHAFCR